jgi:site-specific DNA recombinase
LLAAITGPGRPFDAIVVGEYERAFAADQFERMVPLFERCAVRVWLPEVGGPVDLGDPMHRALMVMLGAQSQREVLRSRHRVLAAMRAQACEQGDTWAAGRLMGIGWSTPARIPIGHMPSGAAVCSGWSQIR